ncbi:MAG: hypothetical protein Q8Q94_00830 [bacterium]|nr:hypothetical protein [bacterium]
MTIITRTSDTIRANNREGAPIRIISPAFNFSSIIFSLDAL